MNNLDNISLRMKKYEDIISDTLRDLYGHLPEFEKWRAEIFRIILTSIAQRPQHLLDLDILRETTDRDWYLKPDMVAYMCYPDRFAENFRGVEKKIPYLKSLGITYLHLLSVLRPREGHNDGGFAVADYYSTNPKYGTMDDLTHLTDALTENKISLCIDFVFNHTAREHDWAQKALAGDPYYQDFYYFFETEEEPKEYEKNLSQVFPETAPGNFTYCDDAKSWVWTTFHPYQWDLNYKNPNVFMEMLKTMLFLANQGIEIFRLDATAYLWKEKGTNCLNLPETHKLLQVFRGIMSLAAPAVCLKAEAIVGARYISKYLGDPAGEKPECQLSYHNALMAALWMSLATGDVYRMAMMIKSLPPRPQGTSWITYLRCHDDIGWGVLTDDRQASWAASKEDLQELNDFYEGKSEKSFARGRIFQKSGQNSFHGTNGTLASLAGLEKAIEEGRDTDIRKAVARITLLYRLIFSFGGIPLLYMGEEVGLFNDYTYDKDDPLRDGRWLHRPRMPKNDEKDEKLKEIRLELFSAVQSIAQQRQQQPLLHADNPTNIIDSGNRHVFSFTRQGDKGILLTLANFSSERQRIEPDVFVLNALPERLVEQFSHTGHNLAEGIILEPYHCMWLKA